MTFKLRFKNAYLELERLIKYAEDDQLKALIGTCLSELRKRKPAEKPVAPKTTKKVAE
jgi:hypothetical protein